jgi:hypothetical protein
MNARVSWVLYLVGSLLVFGSWVHLVPTGVGWIGWLMALAGWAIPARRNSPSAFASRADEIEHLVNLRQRNVLTDEEFEREKRRVLDQAS